MTSWTDAECKDFIALVVGRSFNLTVKEVFSDCVNVSLVTDRGISINEQIRKLKADAAEWRPYVVTHFVSPAEIFVRPKWLDDRWPAFDAEVSVALARAPKGRKILKAGDNVGVFITHWRRGTIIGVKGNDMASVRLVDIGKVVDSELSMLKELPAELLSSNAYCHCVRIANVTPAETSDGSTWSPSAAKTVNDFISESNTIFLRLAVRS